MSKSTASDKHHNIKYDLSSELKRRPIQRTAEAKEDDCHDDETEPNSPEELYPSKDLREDLERVRGATVQKKSERRQQRQPPKRTTEPEEEASKFGDFCSLKNILIVLLLVFSCLFGINVFQSEKPAAYRTIDLTEFISNMKSKFVGQDPQTFNILKSSLKKVLNEDSKPSMPSIVTVITNKGAEIRASDFSAYIGQELAPEHYVSINESVVHRNPDDLKYDIHTEINSRFDNNSLNVAVVDRFHNIPIGAAMIFHSYCDHETAPFKRAIFLFIVHLDRKIPEDSSMRFMDGAAMEALKDVWSDASDDIKDSLITRLTVNVINIK